MSTLNKCMIIGRLGQDPDVRQTQSETVVANLSVATTSRYKDSANEWKEETEWHRVVAWGRLAEICRDYLKKGSHIYVEGPLQTRQWEDKEGQKRYTTEIKALTIQMLDGKQEQSGSSSSSGRGSGGMSSQVDLNENFDDLDDDLPF